MLGLRTVIYKVTDLQSATDWYSKVSETRLYFDELYYVGFNIGGYQPGLRPEEKETSKKSANVVTYRGVDDIDREYRRVISPGATDYDRPVYAGGQVMVATVKDPLQNIAGLIYNPDFVIT